MTKQDNRAGYLFLLPWFAGLVLITGGPVLGSLVLSFTRYNLLSPPTFAGLDNYTRMISDGNLADSLRVTLIYVFVSVPLQLILAFALAIILNRGMRGLALYRSLFYLPSLLGTSVAIAVLWRTIFGGEGLVNALLGVFGIAGESWIALPSTALSTLITLNVWTFGAPMVIFLAGLRQVPTQYYEAARVDGASRWAEFTYITLPLMTPIIFFNLVLQVIGAFRAFTQADVISKGSGGPANSTLMFSLLLYQTGFTQFDMGYASALAWILLVLVAGFTGVSFWSSRYWVFYEE